MSSDASSEIKKETLHDTYRLKLTNVCATCSLTLPDLIYGEFWISTFFRNTLVEFRTKSNFKTLILIDQCNIYDDFILYLLICKLSSIIKH